MQRCRITIIQRTRSITYSIVLMTIYVPRATFEKWVPGGFADGYFEEHFGWEFKGQDAQLDGAFNQVLRYQALLKTPALRGGRAVDILNRR